MEPIEIIDIIDNLKTIYQVEHMQDKLNRWKRLVVETEMKGEWDSTLFEMELDAELAIVKSILHRIKK